MSRKRKKPVVEAAPESEILADGSGPVVAVGDDAAVAEAGADDIAIVPEVAAKPARKGRRAKASKDAAPAEGDVVEHGDEAVIEARADGDAAIEARADDGAGDDESIVDTRGDGDDGEARDADDVAVEAGGDDDEAREGDAGEAAVEADGGDGDAMEARGDGDDSEDGDPVALDETSGETVDADGVGGDEVAAASLPTSAAALDAAQLKSLVEALVFASDKPMTVLRLRQLTRISDTKRLDEALKAIAEDYADRGLILQQVSGGWQFRTRTQWASWVQQLIAGRPVRLTRAQLETLSIIAYRQPITRPEIDDIRGVDSSQTLKLLMDRDLIRCLGKREEVGRPLLYGTTKEFLDFFSLGDLRELPTLREYSELTDESRRVIDDRLGPDDDDDGGDDSGGSGGGGGSNDGGPDPIIQSTEELGLEEIFAGSGDSITGTSPLEADEEPGVDVDAPSDDASDVVAATEASDVDPSAEASSVEASSVEASSVEASSVEASSVEVSSVEASSVEASSVEASSVEAGFDTAIDETGSDLDLPVDAMTVEAGSDAETVEAIVDAGSDAETVEAIVDAGSDAEMVEAIVDAGSDAETVEASSSDVEPDAGDATAIGDVQSDASTDVAAGSDLDEAPAAAARIEAASGSDLVPPHRDPGAPSESSDGTALAAVPAETPDSILAEGSGPAVDPIDAFADTVDGARASELIAREAIAWHGSRETKDDQEPDADVDPVVAVEVLEGMAERRIEPAE